MKLDFSRYTDLIRENLKKGKKSHNFMNQLNEGRASELKALSLSDKGRDKDFFNSLETLVGVTGKTPKYDQQPGRHPDFINIRYNNQIEWHYIVSMFIDISKSTRLFAKYYPDTVANITTTIQRAAVHIAWYFDGFVQRYHGDGLFVYFGGKSITREQSVKNALLASSFFSRFVETELPNLFLEQGIDGIFTRIGIDVGENSDTLWYLAGMEECSEITTCSLHTSLAAHMQGNAKRNGIVVGDNIKTLSGENNSLFKILKDKDGKENRYIYQIPEENFNYTQWDFDWENYLKNIQQLNTAPNANPSQVIQKKDSHQQNSILPTDLNREYLRNQAASIKPYLNE